MAIYKGQTKIAKIYKGNTEIVKRYKGTTVIYQKIAYAVTLTISNEYNYIYKSYFRVYDGQDTTGTLLLDSTGSVATPTPNSLTCSSGYITIVISGNSGDPANATLTATGNITPLSSSLSASGGGGGSDSVTFTVTGAATIAVTYIDWSD